MWAQLDCGQHNPELFWLHVVSFSCLLVSTVRSVEEHVEGFDQRWSLPGGGAGQLNRHGLDRPPRKIKHAAPHLRSGVHGSVRDSSLSYVSSTCLTRINSARFVPLFDTWNCFSLSFFPFSSLAPAPWRESGTCRLSGDGRLGELWWCFCALPGLSWQDKVTALRAKMTERKVSWFVATALDEIACTVFTVLSVFIRFFLLHLIQTFSSDCGSS